jgi:hypothetical protein
MSKKFNVGDVVRVLNDDYGVTNTKMTKGLVTWISNDRKTVKVQILEHEDEAGIGQTFSVEAADFEKINKGFKIGDIVKGITDDYAFTDTRMRKAEILDVYYDEDNKEQLLRLQILDHDSPAEIGNIYDNVKAIDLALVDTENALKTNNGFKVGDFIEGTERADVYNYSDSRTRKAEIIEIFPVKDGGGHDVKIRILDHEDSSEIGEEYAVDSARFDKFVEVKGKGITSLEKGDLVKALPEADKVYGCTSLEAITNLTEFFEYEYFYGFHNHKAVNKIYKELINLGLLPSEIKDKNFLADFFVVVLKYEFVGEEVLDLLVQDLILRAETDTEVEGNITLA